MAIQRLSDDQVRKLTPEQRIKYLRALEEEQKKEAQEAQRKAEEEIAAAEKLISESEEQIEEQEEELKRERGERKTLEEPEEEESLEERLAKEQAQTGTPTGQYRTDKEYGLSGPDKEPSPLYRTLEDAASDLDRLYRTSNWSPEDEERYRDAKEQVQRAGQYQLQSDRLKEDLGLAQDMLNRMHYKH